MAVIEYFLAALGIVLFFAFRWRDDEGTPVGPSAARAGRLLRMLVVPALCGVAIFDWRPTLARHAPIGWLVACAADETSRLRDSSLDEIARRINGGECDDESMATIVRGLWTRRTWHDDGGVVAGRPFDLNLSLLGPQMPFNSDQTLPLEPQLGAIEWRITAAWINGERVATCPSMPPQQISLSAARRAGTLTLPAPASDASIGRGQLRCRVALAYRAPDGRRIGDGWTETHVDPILVRAQ